MLRRERMNPLRTQSVGSAAAEKSAAAAEKVSAAAEKRTAVAKRRDCGDAHRSLVGKTCWQP